MKTVYPVIATALSAVLLCGCLRYSPNLLSPTGTETDAKDYSVEHLPFVSPETTDETETAEDIWALTTRLEPKEPILTFQEQTADESTAAPAYGTAGRIEIPSADISVPLYFVRLEIDDVMRIVNAPDSAAFFRFKLLLTNIRETGKSVICLDPEGEYMDLCEALDGTYIDFMQGEYTINPLEPKAWSDGEAENDPEAPETFRKITRLSQHISFLKDFFRAYKDFNDAQIDTIELLLSKLYSMFGISDRTDYTKLHSSDYPTMQDFYLLCDKTYRSYDVSQRNLYTEETIQQVCLGIHSMCVGAESKYFNGHSNISGAQFLVFGVKGLMDTNKRLKDAMLFNILSYMSNQLLGQGNTAASIDELYLFLTNMTAIEYIRNCMKRVRKKDSCIILASQNIEDFLIPSIREFTKPMFSIPTHQFLFNAGQINANEFMDALQIEPAEFDLIKYPERGTCLYRCGNERYLLQVKAPDYKSVLFGKAGGR